MLFVNIRKNYFVIICQLLYNMYFILYSQCNQTESHEQTLSETKNNLSVSKESKEITIPDIYEVVQQV